MIVIAAIAAMIVIAATAAIAAKVARAGNNSNGINGSDGSKSSNSNISTDANENVVEDKETLKNVIKNKDVLFSYGLFYHLQSHWQVLKTLCYSNLKYFFIETLCGPESSKPEMWWGRENSSSNLNAYSNTEKNLMHGSPNLIWIHQTVNCFGASIQMVTREYQAWRENQEPVCRWRMLIKIVPNTKKSIDISNIWKNVEGTWTV